MIRWACVLVAVTACAGSGPPPARLFAAGAGECPDASGCGVPVHVEPKYAPPDEAHDSPADPDVASDVPREATCTDVGISAAALEIGNYASDEERAPVETKYRARCRTTRLDRSERQCVFEASDAVTIAYCAPRFLPTQIVKFVEVSACADLTQELRDHSPAVPKTHEGQQLREHELAAVQRSCEEDRWTVAFAECARTMPVPSQLMAYCQHVAPAPLVAKFQARMAKVK